MLNDLKTKAIDVLGENDDEVSSVRLLQIVGHAHGKAVSTNQKRNKVWVLI